MILLKDRWMPIFRAARDLERQLSWKSDRLRSRKERGMTADYRAAEDLILLSETIIFPSDTMLELINTLDRIDTRGWIRLPYPFITVQFTSPIPEEKFMANVEEAEVQREVGILHDRVEGILIGSTEQDKLMFPPGHTFNMMNCCVFFVSSCVNRVAWKGSEFPSRPSWENSNFKEHEIPKEQMENKYRMIKLCYAISLFLNAPNVIVQRQRPDPKVQAKRQKKGKSLLKEYHTVEIKKVQVQYEEPSGRKGSSHSKYYPVRGHFRKLKHLVDPICVPNHFRGLKNMDKGLTPSIYKVKEK